jgi:nitrite reductase/ring-hydroxylating ferredoxin subunit
VTLNDHPVLLANVAGDVFAVQNRCGESPLPLQFGTLDDHVLTCSWHGCRYDVRNGHRLDQASAPLAVYPVSIEAGEVRVAVATTPVGKPS